jgi:hypothetical protein
MGMGAGTLPVSLESEAARDTGRGIDQAAAAAFGSEAILDKLFQALAGHPGLPRAQSQGFKPPFLQKLIHAFGTDPEQARGDSDREKDWWFRPWIWSAFQVISWADAGEHSHGRDYR